MRFSKNPPPRKRKHYRNAVTDNPAFVQLLKAMSQGTGQACLSFEPDDPKRLKVDHPWRVATDALRRIIRAEGLPYRASKYQTDSGGWAVQVVRESEERSRAHRTEEGPAAKSA
jgi:hypothetical protein